MTAQTPPTPPAAREWRLETVVFVAATTSSLTSSLEGTGRDGVGEEGEDGEELMVWDELWRGYAGELEGLGAFEGSF